MTEVREKIFNLVYKKYSPGVQLTPEMEEWGYKIADAILSFIRRETEEAIGEDDEIRADLDFIVANTRQIRNALRAEQRVKLSALKEKV